MRFSLNVQFTERELLKFGEDLALRVVRKGIKDGLSGDPEAFAQGLQAVVDGIRRSEGRVDAEFTQSPPPPMDKCQAILETENHSAGRGRHECRVFNGLQRPLCKVRGHMRCDLPPDPPTP
jgi:hypothetical protein